MQWQAANLTFIYLLSALLLVSHHQLWVGHRVQRIVYPIALLLFFLCKLAIPIWPFSHWFELTSLV